MESAAVAGDSPVDETEPVELGVREVGRDT
jgi:hypothetical protein